MKSPKRNIRFLEKQEIEKLIESIKPEGVRNLRDRALMEVLFSTGLRISEALALPDAVFATEKAGTLELPIIGKGDYQRCVFFSPRAMRAVRAYLAARQDSDTRLFPFTVRAAQFMVKRRMAKVYPDKFISPHVFRHSIATHLLKQGVSIYYVQQFLGHRAISSTSVYLHATNKELKDIHTKLFK